jgi:HEAT repeat protein
MTPLERLIGPLPTHIADFRDYTDAVAQAVADAAARDRERFFEVIEQEPTLLENGTILYALGAMKDERVIPLVIPALRSKDSDLRWCAARALKDHRDPRVVDAFIAALRDRSSTVRAVVIEALGKIGGRRALAPLEEALQRPSNQKDDYLCKLLESALKRLRR